MNGDNSWRYMLLFFQLITLIGVTTLNCNNNRVNTLQSGAKIEQSELEAQLANKNLYLDNYTWTVSKTPSVTIIDNQVIDGINIIFLELNDSRTVRLNEAKFSAKENDNVVTVKVKAFCKSYAERVKGRMILTKTSVIDSKISE
jgi:hypothetical protein